MPLEQGQQPSNLRIPLIGLIVNIAMAAVKLVAGAAGHSQALVADGVESLTDVFSSLIVLAGLHIAAQPPDKNHPYGHGKAEALAAMFVAIALAGAAVAIAISAIGHIISPQRAPEAYTLWVLIGVVIVKEILFQVGRRLSRATGSDAVLADAWHHRSDAITSFAAAIGISIALVGGPGYERADGIAALFATVIILINAVKLLLPPLRELMDARPKGVIKHVREVAREVPKVRGIEKVLARKSGRHYLVDMHMEVDPQMTVRDAHEVAHCVKDAVRRALPQVHDVLIHIEPHDGAED